MKIVIEYYKDRKSPYRVRVGNRSIYVATRNEAERIKDYSKRLLGVRS